MADLMAAIGIAQLERLDGYIARRRAAGAIIEDILWEVPGLTPQKIRPGDRSGYYNHSFMYDEGVIGVPADRFADAVNAEGVDCKVYLDGRPLYHYPIFAESRTYGASGYPFVDERGNRRVDYREVRLPVVEKELPGMLKVGGNSSHTEQDALDVGNAIKKVALNYASRR